MIPVVAGILRDAQGRVLVAQRPAGKIAAGQWEFPGGKIEPGEEPSAALRRELAEELGVRAGAMRRLIRLRHAYADRTVELDTWEIEDFDGSPDGLEGQELAWVAPEALAGWPLLAADGPIVTALRLGDQLTVSPPGLSDQALQAGLKRLSGQDVLVRLRLPERDDAAYARVLEDWVAGGVPVLADRDPQAAIAAGARGWHATATTLAELPRRPVPDAMWFSAACHDAAQLARAQALGADFVLLGPVAETPSHPGARPLGWAGFADLLAAVNVPAYAIGGMRRKDLAAARQAGARGVAGIRDFWAGLPGA